MMEVEAVREQVKAVPKLRFVEFNGAWSAGPLENVLDLKSGYIFKSETYVEGGRYRVITIANVQDGRMSFERLSTVAELPDNIRDFQVLQQGDILISLTGNVGRVCLVEVDDCLLNQRVGKLVPKAQVDKDFLYQVLRNEEFLYAMVEQAQGGAQDNLSSKDVLGHEATLPTLPEQQKIAAFLGAVDRKIQQLKRKQALLEQYKKGVVQQLFAQELRFKREDGEEFPEWEERQLSEVLTEHKLASSGQEEVYSVSVHKSLINQIEHLGRVYAADNTDHYNRVLPGDMVYTKSPTGEFKYGIIKQSRLDKAVIVSPLYGVFTPETRALGYWLDAYFESILNTYNYLHPIVQKGAKNTIAVTNRTFLSGTLLLPVAKEEQEKIAGFLMALDAKVAGVAQAVAAAQRWKKGLLQQMFV